MHEEHGTHRDNGSTEASGQEIDRLRAKLEACQHDLRQAHLELARERKIQESLSEQLRAREGAADDGGDTGARVAPSAGAEKRDRAWPLGLWQRMTRSPDERAMLEDIELLRGSKWFDADWYVTEYPDVANASIDPAEHYLRHGALEGRDPGPQFSTEAYMRDHPELAEGGANPLLHFLRSGRDSGA